MERYFEYPTPYVSSPPQSEPTENPFDTHTEIHTISENGFNTSLKKVSKKYCIKLVVVLR